MPPTPLFHTPALPFRGARTRHAALVCAATPPKRISAIANDLREALQASLTARTSRIVVQLPPRARLGTEPKQSESPTQPASDRQLARLLAGMFENTGLSVRVLFPSPSEEAAARKVWGPAVECQLAAVGQGSVKKRRKKGGFGAAKGDPAATDVDVYIVTGGGAATLAEARRLAQRHGQDRLVIVANPNSKRDQLPIDLERFCDTEFEQVYYFQPNPHPRWSGGVLFRKFPDDWVLCRLSAVGMLQQLLVKSEKPSESDIAAALAAEEAKSSGSLLNKISSFIDRNVS